MFRLLLLILPFQFLTDGFSYFFFSTLTATINKSVVYSNCTVNQISACTLMHIILALYVNLNVPGKTFLAYFLTSCMQQNVFGWVECWNVQNVVSLTFLCMVAFRWQNWDLNRQETFPCDLMAGVSPENNTSRLSGRVKPGTNRGCASIGLETIDYSTRVAYGCGT